MDNSSRYFFISGVISLSLFAFFAALFFYMLFIEKQSKIYALQKKSYISVSLATLPTKTKVTKHTTASNAKVVSSKKTVKNVKQDIDVKDLFADVWTPKITQKKSKRKVNANRLNDMPKKVKKLSVSNEKKLTQKISESQKQNADKELVSASAGDEVNEYLAKIQAIVYKYFHVPPNSEGESVKSVIELDPLGRVKDFRVLQYSQNEALNREVDAMKERLKSVIFPKNPHNKSSRTVVVLISKE